MLDRLRERKPLRTGLQRAALHWAKAGYEVLSGWAAIAEEVAAALREPPEESQDDRPQHIAVD